MCLNKKTIFPRISSKPITCYKLVLQDVYHCLRSYVMAHKFNIGDIIKNKRCFLFGIFSNTLKKDVVHAYLPNVYTRHGYTSYENLKHYNSVHYFTKYIECEIPPYTPYWINKAENEIGATKIKTIKVIE